MSNGGQPQPILQPYFEAMSEQLMTQYNTSQIQQASRNKGDNRELFCSEFLRKMLPPKLSVRSGGEIWDSVGGKTGELDVIVIRDDAASLTFGANDSFLAEGTFAVIEVKSNLNQGQA